MVQPAGSCLYPAQDHLLPPLGEPTGGPGGKAGLWALARACEAGLGLRVGTPHTGSQGLQGKQQLLEGSPDPRDEGLHQGNGVQWDNVDESAR